MTETLKLVATEYAAACMGKVESVARSRDRHWWAGVGLYLWTAFLFGNVLGEIWRLAARANGLISARLLFSSTTGISYRETEGAPDDRQIVQLRP